MNRIKRYYSAFSRYRKSSGFGIHSPFAFYFVTKVLRERLPYYNYDKICDTRKFVISMTRKYGQHPRIISIKNAKLLFRIVNFFKPKCILLFGTSYGVSTMSMLGVSSKIKLVLCEPHLSTFPATEKVLSPYMDNISLCTSATTAINQYNHNECDSIPFIVINSIENSDVTDINTYLQTIVKEEKAIIIMRNISRHESVALLWKGCKEQATYGMTFSNERFAIMVVSNKLPRQDFSLWF